MPANAEIPEAFVPPRLCVSDSTIEKLAILLQARPHGMLYIRDELAGLFLNLSRYSGGTDKEFWLEAWNGKPYSVERVNRPPVDVQHLLVGITGGFQPDKLVRSFDGDADGLYARFLFAWPTEAPYQPLTDTVEEVEPEFQNAVSRLIDLAESAEGKLVIRDVGLTPDAVTRFEQFRQLVYQKKDGLDGREREWWVKAPAHVLRLAGTLAYLDWAMEVGRHDDAGAEYDRGPFYRRRCAARDGVLLAARPSCHPSDRSDRKSRQGSQGSAVASRRAERSSLYRRCAPGCPSAVPRCRSHGEAGRSAGPGGLAPQGPN